MVSCSRLAVLAAAGLLFGIVPGAENLIDVRRHLPGGAHYHLALWHGSTLLLLLSGGVRWWRRSFLATGVARVRAAWLPLGNADRIYDASSGGWTSPRCGDWRNQRGSLPATQSAILSTWSSPYR